MNIVIVFQLLILIRTTLTEALKAVAQPEIGYRMRRALRRLQSSQKRLRLTHNRLRIKHKQDYHQTLTVETLPFTVLKVARNHLGQVRSPVFHNSSPLKMLHICNLPLISSYLNMNEFIHSTRVCVFSLYFRLHKLNCIRNSGVRFQGFSSSNNCTTLSLFDPN